MKRFKPSALSNPNVSGVSDVQAPIHAGLRCNVSETADVSGVSATQTKGKPETSETSEKNMTFQRKAPIHAGCTSETSETSHSNDIRCKRAGVKKGGA